MGVFFSKLQSYTHSLVVPAEPAAQLNRKRKSEEAHDGRAMKRYKSPTVEDGPKDETPPRSSESSPEKRKRSKDETEETSPPKRRRSSDEALCSRLAKGLAKWRAAAEKSGKPLNAHTDAALNGTTMEEAEVYRAIACVTEAVSDNGVNLYSLLTPQIMASALDAVLPKDQATIGRPEEEVLIPIESPISGKTHMALLLVWKSPRSYVDPVDNEAIRTFNVSIIESTPEKALDSHYRRAADLYRKQLRNAGWSNAGERHIGPLLIPKPYVTKGSTHQSHWIQTMITVFNAWTIALGISTVNDYPSLCDGFLRDGATMINLALRGCMDAHTIQAFLEHYDYIERGQAIDSGRSFDQTVSLVSLANLEERLDMLHKGNGGRPELERSSLLMPKVPSSKSQCSGKTVNQSNKAVVENQSSGKTDDNKAKRPSNRSSSKSSRSSRSSESPKEPRRTTPENSPSRSPTNPPSETTSKGNSRSDPKSSPKLSLKSSSRSLSKSPSERISKSPSKSPSKSSSRASSKLLPSKSSSESSSRASSRPSPSKCSSRSSSKSPPKVKGSPKQSAEEPLKEIAVLAPQAEPCANLQRRLQEAREEAAESEGAIDLLEIVGENEVPSEETMRFAVFSVTEAISTSGSAGGPSFSIFAPGNSLARPGQDVIIPFSRTVKPHYLKRQYTGLMDIRAHTEGSGNLNVSLLKILNTCSARPADRQCMQVRQDIKEVVEQSGWCGTQAPPARPIISYGQPEWTKSGLTDGRQWVAALLAILEAWRIALDLPATTNTVKVTDELVSQSLEVINLAASGLMDSAAINAFFDCFGLIEKGSRVSEERRFYRTMYFKSEIDVTDQMGKLNKANTEEQAEEPDFPDTAFPSDESLKPCEYLVWRIRQWHEWQRYSGIPPVTVVRKGHMMVAEDSTIAIAAVTEALPSVTRDSFSLLPVTVRQYARFEPIPLVQDRIIRPGQELLAVIDPPSGGEGVAEKTLIAHIGLAILRPATGSSSKPRIYIYDSLPGLFHREHFLYLKTVIENSGWEDEDAQTPTRQVISSIFTRQKVAQQKDGWACGLHATLNAWCYALGLKVNPDMEPTDAFYSGLVNIINLAMSGCMDSATIHAFLLCHTYIKVDQEIAEDRRFSATKAFPDSTTLNKYAIRLRWKLANEANWGAAGEWPTDPDEIDDIFEHIGIEPPSPSRNTTEEYQVVCLLAFTTWDQILNSP